MCFLFWKQREREGMVSTDPADKITPLCGEEEKIPTFHTFFSLVASLWAVRGGNPTSSTLSTYDWLGQSPSIGPQGWDRGWWWEGPAEFPNPAGELFPIYLTPSDCSQLKTVRKGSGYLVSPNLQPCSMYVLGYKQLVLNKELKRVCLEDTSLSRSIGTEIPNLVKPLSWRRWTPEKPWGFMS